ncbi:hypothetical protein FACS1894200_00740 [Spirochaetia bacterium]|nr:hypothetical protein FACS1894200_00740 [Spirochaetia bacterium]
MLKFSVIKMLIKRTVLFFFALCLFSLFLYGIGSAQGFMDSTLLLLLRFAILMAIFLSVGSIYGLAMNLFLFFRFRGSNKAPYFIEMGGYMLLGLFGALVATTGILIITALRGNVG